jgi:transcription elongation GreA/GreB family factor
MSAIKRELIHQLKTALAREIEVLERAAHAARDAATHEENRPENDKDTRAVEAAYLAGAQAGRARELARVVNALEFLPLRAFQEDDPIAASALIEVDVEGKRSHYFLAPQGGGLRAEIDGVTIQVITPQSPVGQALLGKTVGSVVEVRAEGRAREYEIIAVR